MHRWSSSRSMFHYHQHRNEFIIGWFYPKDILSECKWGNVELFWSRVVRSKLKCYCSPFKFTIKMWTPFLTVWLMCHMWHYAPVHTANFRKNESSFPSLSMWNNVGKRQLLTFSGMLPWHLISTTQNKSLFHIKTSWNNKRFT